jgi:molecular chaperone DnaJ
VPKKRTVTIKVPPGVHEGQGIRVAGEGEPGRDGGPNGDLYVYVRIRPHEFLERDGNDLIAVVPISFTQAALGATIDVPSLDGTRQLKVPPGTQYGSLFRIRDRTARCARPAAPATARQVTVETNQRMPAGGIAEFAQTKQNVSPSQTSSRTQATSW